VQPVCPIVVMNYSIFESVSQRIKRVVLNLVDLGVDLLVDLCLPWTSALEAGNNLKRRGVRWIPTLLGPFLEVSLRNLAATGGRPLYILQSPTVRPTVRPPSRAPSTQPSKV
jgi:hypothetical protein